MNIKTYKIIWYKNYKLVKNFNQMKISIIKINFMKRTKWHTNDIRKGVKTA